MKNTPISNQSSPSIQTTSANVANVSTPIMVITVPRGAVYDLPNQTQVRGAVVKGVAPIIDLKDSTGAKIRTGTLFIGSQAPSDEFVTQHRGISLTAFADLTSSQQRSEDFRYSIAQASDLNVGDVLILGPDYQLVISLNAGQVVDWTKSFIEFPIVEENK